MLNNITPLDASLAAQQATNSLSRGPSPEGPFEIEQIPESSLPWPCTWFLEKLYLTSTYLAGKYIVTILSLPSTWYELPDGTYGYSRPTDLDVYKREGLLTRENKGSFINVKVTTEDHITLDGVEIHFEGEKKERQEQIWHVFYNPNTATYEMSMESFLEQGQGLGHNFLLINYRGTGDSEKKNPSCFGDLVKDGTAAVEYLIASGVPKENIIIEGLSLGGAVAIHVNLSYKVRCAAHNTFGTSVAMVPHLCSAIAQGIKEILDKPLHDTLDLTSRLKYALKDLIGSPIELFVRITFFVLAFFERIISLEGGDALITLKEIGKTIIFDTILTITGAIALITSCFTQKVLELNTTLNQMMRVEDDPLVSIMLQSSKAHYLIQRLLVHTGWAIDNVEACKKTSSPFASYHPGPKDTTVPPELALNSKLQDLAKNRTHWELHMKDGEDANHGLPASHKNSGQQEQYISFMNKIVIEDN